MNADRLGTYEKTFPYGELAVTTPTSGEKFATYWRDSATALDYAVNRYYSSQMGRFLSADQGPPVPTNPQSWNRYAYAWDDPVNLNDKDGLLPTWAFYPFYEPFLPTGGGYPYSPTITQLGLLHGIVSVVEDVADWVQPNFGGGGGYNIGIPAGFSQYMMDAGVLVQTAPGWGTLGGIGIRIVIAAGGTAVITVGSVAVLAAVGYILYQAKVNADAEAADKADCQKLPDPTEENFGKGPGSGWEWNPPGNPDGAWIRRPTPGGGKESARPDRDLGGQHGNRPHWDYKGKNGTEWWGWGSGDCERKR